jgi:small-conductance mechanosensitive channel
MFADLNLAPLEEALRKLEASVPTALTKHEYWDNTPLKWLLALGLALGAGIALRVLMAIIVRKLGRLAARSTTKADDIAVGALGATHSAFYVALGIYFGSLVLNAKPSVHDGMSAAMLVALILQAGHWAQTVFQASALRWAEKRGERDSGTIAAGMTFVARLAIWAIVFLLVLSNLGIEISALIAGLGVGGIAAALALQTLLADVFASLSMYFDRPFDIGDFVTIGEFLGTVEEIGLRTTRLRALSGEQIVYPNGELIKSQIRNYARMSERRILFRFGIEYNLAPEKVEMAARLPREVIESVDGVRFDRCHFATYGDYALEYEVVYYVLSPDYAVYMDRHHAINLGMYRRFRDEGIPFAFPTRTLIHRTEQPAPTQDRAT